jgi:hypothetical protein
MFEAGSVAVSTWFFTTSMLFFIVLLYLPHECLH